jgi:hypothetical protein
METSVKAIPHINASSRRYARSHNALTAGSITQKALLWWARSQRIRTAAELPFEIPLFQTAAAPVYQRIAARALHLRQLGFTPAVIARYLDVSEKTATKAIEWILRPSRYHN